ncbi:winged helix DNA-binding domain-containing protein [Streptomyces triticagri]|uniref:Winged helix DNA-binding domain-containing protein n=1 Tax=Streptomyces triticagri TaxID=2293568 RepID=A0A372M1H7_9ACTN|nr:winged helix DNA-binding domain-containing protein [Streptomyces triticagri]RFU84679.1 winged helix DNA-binding domain-containing protein [Streptomyces triticagri]
MTNTPQVLGPRALNRATLSRQLLLDRAPMRAGDALTHLVGLQAQNVKPPYYALAARLADFDPAELSDELESRRAVRTVTLRSTLHLHTAADARALRDFTRPAIDGELRHFRSGLAGVDLDRLTALSREFVAKEPRTPKDFREELARSWPQADPQALGVAARCLLPLVQVTPRGLWRRSGRVALVELDQWLAESSGAGGDATAAAPLRAEDVIPRYLAAFGPASVKDMQAWARLTRLRPAFERLAPRLRTFHDENGTVLHDLPDAPRPDPDTPAPPRFLPEFDNLLLSHADRTRVVPAAYKGRSWKGNQSFSVFLLDGFLAGVWQLTQDKDTAVLTIEPFGTPNRAQRADLTAEAAALLEGPLHTDSIWSGYDIRFGTVVDT